MAIDKQDLDVLNDKNTIVIIPEIGKEYEIVHKYLRQFAPKVVSEQRVFTELVMSSLQTDVSVVMVFRDFANPVQVTQLDNSNNLHYVNRPDSDLFGEVHITDPVKVSKYWVRDNPLRPGRPDNASILEALGKEALPWRLDFIDKGEPRPEILKLVKV